MRNLGNINLPISLVSLLLVSVGILVIYSSSKELALQQLIFTGIGIVFFFLVSQIELESLRNLIKPLYIFILIVLVAVLILGIETRGALRWIPLGIFNIQPSEFAKPILILMLAKFWSEHSPNWLNILKSLLWFAPSFVLVFKQPDLGSALTLIAIWLGILLVTHISIRKILILAAIFIFVIPTSWSFLHDYQRERILSFLAPESDPLGKGYNLIQSTIAVGSGELFGRGLGRGTQSRLQFLPEFRTDFIFASIAEEMGFVGSLLILSLYLFLLFYFLRVAQRVNNSFSLLVVMGVVSMFLFQVFVNIGMNVGLLPITGITLPLISYGGSSIVATFLLLGMVASCARKR
ncbi:rod shape-determining protein RodA [Candidatus Daviesbacteria bacterium RIFCSPHIGHO2_01_FULL_40_11]|uniref:Rod shape-determining protein RodA n=1 Tax=Candidatus Daviesbacteria bacterium RIFCSPHIGHO2_01_FULL_40_11 TaxID=1797762 RepID=A0A1F5JH07_9BACT|nr:MAG: rod shape-determining protein RodA [Candidatus Daviesbacteria bacterium RIFCSPHIGHO2_01_FULL_40_11]OGE62820.1 MAG: rod shape-determining protein RodA [Candidatus Daviesbacteria bacterium RIFCSPLOWO2_01_FULL_40_27]